MTRDTEIVINVGGGAKYALLGDLNRKFKTLASRIPRIYTKGISNTLQVLLYLSFKRNKQKINSKLIFSILITLQFQI